MNIQLSDHFSYKRLLKFTLSPIVMMIFSSIYWLVDGIFVSNIVGKTAFSAVNFIWPVIMILSTTGFLLGTGGSALVSKTLGEKNKQKANELFSMFIYLSIIIGVILSILGIVFVNRIGALMGGKGQMLKDATLYAQIVLIALPAYTLQLEFNSFFSTAEKPHLGLLVTVISGVCNMILDALFIAVFKLGIAGAALATGISQFISVIISMIYFAKSKTSLISLTKFKMDFKALFKACSNGFSELLSNVSMSLVGVVYNIQLLKLEGENGIAAYGALNYVCMIFLSIFIGFAFGTAPIIGYNFGAKNHAELKNVTKKSIVITIIASISMFVISELLAYPLSYVFASYDPYLFDLTKRAFILYSFSYLFAGIGIFGSSFFTALNNGLISAICSFLRTVIFQLLFVWLLPIFIKTDGVWLSIAIAEFLAAMVCIIFMVTKRKKYHY